jgi:hypothetical protein
MKILRQGDFKEEVKNWFACYSIPPRTGEEKTKSGPFCTQWVIEGLKQQYNERGSGQGWQSPWHLDYAIET